MGREMGGGIGMGKTCEPKAFSFQCVTKFTTNKKIKIKKKRKKITNYITLKKKNLGFSPCLNCTIISVESYCLGFLLPQSVSRMLFTMH